MTTRTGHRWFRSAVVAAAIVVGCVGLAPSSAIAGGLTTARSDLMRLQVRLCRAALSDPAVLAARDESGKAAAHLYQVRQNVLIRLYETEEYGDLRVALWAKQRLLEGNYVEIPMRAQSIVANAKDALSIRARMTTLETKALEANETYVQARDDAVQKAGLYQKAQRDAIDSVRNDPQVVASVQQLRAMTQSITGWRPHAVATAQ